MRGQHADKLWIAGGAIAAALLFLLTWTLLVAPKHEQTEATRLAATEAADKLDIQRQALKRLAEDNANLPSYKAELDTYANALPAKDEYPDLLRTLRATAAKYDVQVTALTASNAAKVEGVGTSIYDMPLSMTVQGALNDLQAFLDDLQQHESRAVLIDSVNVTSNGDNIDATQGVTISLALHVFVSGAAPVVEGQQVVS
ncbi:type 4a pilus biogenesis protein PilO [Catenuloplanes sp. NPDC051500]|uniref:type 4a pilus biogenesis protein PilO n=1 Tax=Catenuloplanes sp. NPDC051500 TaxID=3363959 RepID=UPI00378C13FD